MCLLLVIMCRISKIGWEKQLLESGCLCKKLKLLKDLTNCSNDLIEKLIMQSKCGDSSQPDLCWLLPIPNSCPSHMSLYSFPVHSHPTLWRPEYASYMIEGTPGQPYGGTMSEFNTVEGNMAKRRREASSVLNHNQTLCTITSFPRHFTPTLFHYITYIFF